MRLTENQYELIEAYLNQELSAKDRATFERDSLADAEFLAEVGRQRELRLGLRAIGIQQVLEQARTRYQASLPATSPGRKAKTSGRSFPAWRYWAAAATIAVIAGLSYYAYRQTADRPAELAFTQTSPAGADNELLKSFPAGTVSVQTRTTFLDAFKNYQSGKYDQVIGQLKTLPADKQTIHYKNYLLGLSYLANKQPTEAIPLLDRAQATPLPELRQKAEWFLALAYVKNHQKERALPILKRISTTRSNPFQSLAGQVLAKIE